MKTAVIGFPRIGKLRELKFASEKFFRKEISEEELLVVAKTLRKEHWMMQKEAGINYISSNDFSFYDGMLDTAIMLGAIPQSYKKLGLDELNTYFAMARGYQGEHGDVKALAMKKWFNTNYHYMVPELYDDMKIKLNAEKLINEYKEAKELGIETKPVVIGPFTFLELANCCGNKKVADYVPEIIMAYKELLVQLNQAGTSWIQMDEPYLVTDLEKDDIRLLETLYQEILKEKGNVKVLLQTYFGDVRRIRPITVEYSRYAQSLTKKPVKGMLTGPVTILNWSFPREDISLKEMAYQIGIAIREEVCDLEAAGIRVIQIDEAALKEKLPIRKDEWYSGYLDWAIPAFRLCAGKVRPETQIHTHMCYSEFDEIVRDIDHMDADVISFEASRSKLTIIDALRECGFETEVGPGVYDIHSPRVPSVDEMVEALEKMLNKIDKEKLWVNPDCGLKTRGIPETEASLKNLVTAAKVVRAKLEA